MTTRPPHHEQFVDGLEDLKKEKKQKDEIKTVAASCPKRSERPFAGFVKWKSMEHPI